MIAQSSKSKCWSAFVRILSILSGFIIYGKNIVINDEEPLTFKWASPVKFILGLGAMQMIFNVSLIPHFTRISIRFSHLVS